MIFFSKSKYAACFVCMVLSLLNAGCARSERQIAVSLTAYNHGEHGVGSYMVTLADGSSAEAGYLAPAEGGGGDTCCLSIPAAWKPGMQATVVMYTVKNGKDIRVEQTVPVPKYAAGDAGRFVVHFLHDGSYKVFVTKYSLGHRKYPLSGKEAELEPGVPLEIIWE
ncbi:DUF3304 domain-containing protein [Janthinobacterium sp. SUN033]|uniref:DUF3304 domain-containing protein n=1 Tax=Janthinobacterium sp. SUN033 TaxID=3002439 RepID=UPI0025B24E2C|nr:DUF3304 domain-containing protein [Janthinobacterium sp. SUN033]MDN2676437.1 DUF3304 domain-containing protein [Janthinobacterium sp. SUN033]